MNKKIFKICLTGFIFVGILGTIWHFLYELTGENKIVGLFCPVNESPWEHLKLLYFPYLIYTFITMQKLQQDKFNVYFSAYISVLAGMLSVLNYYYTLNGALGGNNSWVNISSFFVGIALMFTVNYLLLGNSIGKGIPNGIAFALLIIGIIIFGVFTVNPPIIPLFKDPQSLSYGMG